MTVKLGNLGTSINSALGCETCQLTMDRMTQLHWSARLDILAKQVKLIRSWQKCSILNPVYSFHQIASREDLSAIKLAIWESRVQNRIISHNEQITATFIHILGSKLCEDLQYNEAKFGSCTANDWRYRPWTQLPFSFYICLIFYFVFFDKLLPTSRQTTTSKSVSMAMAMTSYEPPLGIR